MSRPSPPPPPEPRIEPPNNDLLLLFVLALVVSGIFGFVVLPEFFKGP